MVTTPGLSETLAAEIAALYARAHEYLIARMAAKIGPGIAAPAWAARQMTEVTAYRQHADQVMRAVSRESASPIGAAIRSAAKRGDESAREELIRRGSIGRARTTDVDNRTVANLAAQLHNQLEHMRPTVVNSAMNAYQRVVNESLAGTATGTETRQQAAQRALNRFAADGVTGFNDAAGRRWSMDTYVEMSTRTSMMNATVEGHTQRLLNMGEEFVVVSDHAQECKMCRPWEGEILSLTGSNTGRVEMEGEEFQVKGTLQQARSAGLFHPNCRHSYSLYIPGVSKAFGAKADPEGDKARQKLRRLEREKRQLLRMKAASLDPAQTKLMNQKIAAKTKQIKDHVASVDGLKRIPARESLHTGR